MRLVLALLALVLLAPGVALAKSQRKSNPGAAPPLAIIEQARVVMGAQCVGLAQGRADSAATARTLDAAFDEITRLEDVLGSTGDSSELARLNASAASERFACSADLYAAVDSAMRTADETNGALDPTSGPLARAWDLYGKGRVPSKDEIAEAYRHVGWRALMREPTTRFVHFTRPGMMLDLTPIARGYALDRAADLLLQRGIARALFQFGATALALSNREPWQVSVPFPGDPQTPALRLALTNAALSTAAQSEQIVAENGARFGRVLDPRTGMPVRTTGSVSVVARGATRAEAVSTALLVMGRQDASQYAANHPTLGVLWLEPASDGLHAWAWNLPSVEAEPGVKVIWMTQP